MERKQPVTTLERIQNRYREYPQPFWALMAGTFIDRLERNLVIPFLAIYVAQRFDAKITQVGLIYAISFAGSTLSRREGTAYYCGLCGLEISFVARTS